MISYLSDFDLFFLINCEFFRKTSTVSSENLPFREVQKKNRYFFYLFVQRTRTGVSRELQR